MESYTSLNNEISKTANDLAVILEAVLPQAAGYKEDLLFESMRYAVLSNGKRIRPFLTICAAGLFGVDRDCAMRVAASIELIHTYSLVHDDLPALDNDEIRRGLPSCHSAFGEATAILTGDALLTLAFEVLSSPATHADANVRIDLIRLISKAAGYKGLVGGQMMDLLSAKQALSFPEIVRLQRLKTGELFAMSCEAAAIMGKVANNLRSSLRAYAHNIGLIFQITDDILDASGERGATGKKPHTDSQNNKPTLVTLWGVEKCRNHIDQLIEQSISHLSVFDNRAVHLRDLAYFLKNRAE